MDIIFWDIDGTLIRSGRAGLYAFQAATAELWGDSVDLAGINAAGMTDYSIAGEIIAAISGRPATHEEKIVLAERYEDLLAEHLDRCPRMVLPSIRDILATLQETAVQSLLLTGNSRKGAEIKLRKFGLDGYFDFDRSAFCENSPTRDDVAARALNRAEDLKGGKIFVVGDTPHDVRCGKNIGAYTIGVATGTFSLMDLMRHSPWWAVEKLPSAPEFLARLATAGL